LEQNSQSDRQPTHGYFKAFLKLYSTVSAIARFCSVFGKIQTSSYWITPTCCCDQNL